MRRNTSTSSQFSAGTAIWTQQRSKNNSLKISKNNVACSHTTNLKVPYFVRPIDNVHCRCLPDSYYHYKQNHQNCRKTFKKSRNRHRDNICRSCSSWADTSENQLRKWRCFVWHWIMTWSLWQLMAMLEQSHSSHSKASETYSIFMKRNTKNSSNRRIFTSLVWR